MSRKPKDSPLNLIQILPPKHGDSTSNPYNPASAHFKIQIDAEEPSRWISWITRVVSGIAVVLNGTGKIVQWTLNQAKRASALAGMGVKLLTEWMILVMKTIAKGTIRCALTLVNLSKHVGCRIQGSARQAWRKKRQRSHRSVAEPKDGQTDEQRDELLQEVHALRNQLSAHQHELAQVTTQMGELKALVLSQQQVLLHLGKELEAAEKRAAAQDRVSPRRTRNKTTKSVKSKKPESPKPPLQPHLGVETHH